MKFLPFSIIPLDKLRKGARHLGGVSRKAEKLFPTLSLDLSQAEIEISIKEYIAICMFASLSFFVFICIILFVVLTIAKVAFDADVSLIPTTLVIAVIITFFVFLQQINYPKLIKAKRVRDIESNLLHAMRSILVQVDSGAPLFDVLVSIGNGNYGEVSKAFSKAVKQISAGRSQADALKDLTTGNPSIFFRRAMWQVSNGMKAGSDIAEVIKEVIKSISSEQMNQIRTYGAQLNPIAMFYMLLTVILPSLSVTFLIVISSFMAFSETTTKMIFSFLLGGVLFIQMIFLGATKSKRPTLMGE
ncbi:MAG: type II secretion system F family protein [Candidatus Woesearchaeota archaeon]